MSLKHLRSQLLTLLSQKSLHQLHSLILNSLNQGLPSYPWRKYIVEIFALLTDPDPEFTMPTFVRRGPVFGIFRAAVEGRLGEGKGAVLGQIVEYLLRIVQGIFSAITSRREIDKSMQKSFHTWFQKLLLQLHNHPQNPPQSFPQKSLTQLYPHPENPNLTCEFIYPDLLLWYQLLLVIRNTIQGRGLDGEGVVAYVGRLGVCARMCKEPVLRWVGLYCVVGEAVRVWGWFGGQGEGEENGVESICIKSAIGALSQIRQHFAPYLQANPLTEKPTPDRQNMLLTSIRFNLISLSYTLLDSLPRKPNSQLHKAALQQLKRAIGILMPRVRKERLAVKGEQDGQGRGFYERLFKFQMELTWIGWQIGGMCCGSLCGMYREVVEEDGDSQFKKKDTFRTVLEREIAQYRKAGSSKLSQSVRMSQIITAALPVIDQDINQFRSCLQTLSPGQQLSLLTALLTQYHISTHNLLLATLQSSLSSLTLLLSTPQSLTSTHLQPLTQTLRILSLSRKDTSLYICGYCGLFQVALFCGLCGQACMRFRKGEGLLMNLGEYWLDCVRVCQYFLGNQLERVQGGLAGELLVVINACLNT